MSKTKQADHDMRRCLDDRLDQGLKETFPASDPPAVTAPKRQTSKREPKLTRQLKRRGFAVEKAA